MNARTILRSALTLVAALLLSVSANAQLFRAYLAPTGVDTNPCTLPAPCRLLPAALAAVADGGEIWMLDSANYNTATVTIGKSVSILAVPGAVGSVLAIGGPAISITAGGMKVALRNLVIVPLVGSGGADGVYMTGASTLFIENSLIANLTGAGVAVFGLGKLNLVDTIIRNNGGFAVSLQHGASATIARTQMLANGDGGVFVGSMTPSYTTASITDSIIAGGFEGVYALTANIDGIVRVFVTRCTIEGNYFGLETSSANGGSSVVALSSNMITKNNYAWVQNSAGAVIRTLGNNHITDNTDTYGILTPVALQ